MKTNDRPVAVIDSGIGGISVLREFARVMPHENIIYYGDSLNAPYGEKTVAEVRELTFAAVEKLLALDCKALIVACNTATSAAVRSLRALYPSLPIVGIEPAIKPAVIYGEQVLGKTDGSSRVLIMATPVTLSQDKFARLTAEYAERADILPLPCPHLAELIESGELESPELADYLEGLLAPYVGVDSVVLGCTHYPFVRGLIERYLPNTAVFDGGEGTAREAARRIRAAGLERCPPTGELGRISFISSKGDDAERLYRRFFEM